MTVGDERILNKKTTEARLAIAEWLKNEGLLEKEEEVNVAAEGEEEKVIRAALSFRNAGYGNPILVAREHRVKETIARLGLEDGRHPALELSPGLAVGLRR